MLKISIALICIDMVYLRSLVGFFLLALFFLKSRVGLIKHLGELTALPKYTLIFDLKMLDADLLCKCSSSAVLQNGRFDSVGKRSYTRGEKPGKSNQDGRIGPAHRAEMEINSIAYCF